MSVVLLPKSPTLVIPKLDWFELPCKAPQVRRAGAFGRISSPTVMIDVTEVRGTRVSPGGTILRIVALFRWPTLPERGIQHLWLRKDQLIEVHGSFEEGKKIAAGHWARHLRDEGELLAEMWALPVMTETELADYYKRWNLRKREAEEEAAPLIEQRKQEIALEGGRVD